MPNNPEKVSKLRAKLNIKTLQSSVELAQQDCSECVNLLTPKYETFYRKFRVLWDKKHAALAKNRWWREDSMILKISKLERKYGRVKLFWDELQETLLYCNDLTAELDELEQDLNVLWQEGTLDSKRSRMRRRVDRLDKDVRRYKREVIWLVGDNAPLDV